MFYFDEEAMSEMLSLTIKNIDQMRNMENGYLENMSPLSNSGIYGNGVQMIDSQIVAIKDGLTDFRNITTDNSNALVELEKRLKQEVDNIALPKNFDADDVGYSVDGDVVTLSKEDGQSINKDADTTVVAFNDNFTDKSKDLYELKDTELSENKLTDEYNFNKKDIDKLETTDLNENKYNDKYDVEEENLSKLKEETLTEAGLEDIIDIEKEKLDEMKTSATEQEEFEFFDESIKGDNNED